MELHGLAVCYALPLLDEFILQAKFKDKGNEIAEDQVTQMSKQMDVFRSNLEEFASKHKDEIRKNAAFRVQFQEMCASIGVDPLACKKCSLFMETDNPEFLIFCIFFVTLGSDILGFW